MQIKKYHKKDPELILKNGYKPKGTHFEIRVHFPKEIEEKRKETYPVFFFRQAKKDKKKASLVRDELYINDELYESHHWSIKNEKEDLEFHDIYTNIVRLSRRKTMLQTVTRLTNLKLRIKDLKLNHAIPYTKDLNQFIPLHIHDYTESSPTKLWAFKFESYRSLNGLHDNESGSIQSNKLE